eukprot:3461223-Pyramimonas_sp.AAC.1
MVLEHATKSQRSTAPSICLIPGITGLLSHACIKKVDVHQCRFGSQALKPTSSWCVHARAVQVVTHSQYGG